MSEGEASFNMAVPTLQRMDLLLKKISKYALNRDYEMWKDVLEHLRREVACYIKPKQFTDINDKLKELQTFEWIIIDEQGRKKYVDSQINKVRSILDETTILIQQAMFSSGLLMARKEAEEGWD